MALLNPYLNPFAQTNDEIDDILFVQGGNIVNNNDYEEKFIDAMVDFWVKDDAPIWVKQKVKEEL